MGVDADFVVVRDTPFPQAEKERLEQLLAKLRESLENKYLHADWDRDPTPYLDENEHGKSIVYIVSNFRYHSRSVTSAWILAVLTHLEAGKFGTVRYGPDFAGTRPVDVDAELLAEISMQAVIDYKEAWDFIRDCRARLGIN